MATVEQRDTQPSGLAPLSNTIDIFNDFKDDKDSDEESFHLPMLDCDDDLDNKENVMNSIDKDIQCQGGETEDDILNKFETTVTPDIDPKIEDKLLDEIDDPCEKKPNEESAQINSADEVTGQNLQSLEKNDAESTVENHETDKDVKPCLKSPEVQSTNNPEEEKLTEQQGNENEKNQEKPITEEVHNTIKEQTDDEVNQSENKNDNLDLSGSYVVIDETGEEDDLTQVAKESDKAKDNTDNNENIANEDIEMDTVTSNTLKEKSTDLIETDEIENNTTEENQKTQTPNNCEMEIEPSKENEAEEKEKDSKVTTSESSEICKNEVETENETIKLDSEHESMNVDIPQSDDKKDSSTESVQNSDSKKDSPNENSSDLLIKTSTQSKKFDENGFLDEKNNDTILDKKETEKQVELTTLDKLIKPNEIISSKSDEIVSERCEDSDDSNKNLDCDDDLFDISIIRDADEDNASAIAENANDNQCSEKSDNDDQEEGSEKAENELEENEMDQEDSLLANDKDERMDFDDGNSSNLAYQDNTVSGDTSDSEVKYDDIRDSETDSNNSSVLKEKTNRINDNIVDSEKNQTDELSTDMKDSDSQSVSLDDKDSLKENSVKLGGKRSLSETEITAASKKIKLSETIDTSEKKKPKKFKTLLTFEKFMQNKKIETKLTRSDLEQFCLQKICEAIVHKTDVGELHQTIKKQEQIIENLRKDLQQLTKQTRDLDIVNKKLMNELRAQNGIKKPLVPLKITRSVGLQVKLNIGIDNNNSRRKTPANNINPRTPSANNTPRQRSVAPANARVVRQIAPSPRKTPTSTPLLSQALQTNRQVTPTATKRPQVGPKSAEPQKPGNPGVIDLTDEDDKAAKAATGTPIKIPNKTVPLSSINSTVHAKNLNFIQNKSVTTKTINTINQNKTVAIGQVKTATGNAKVATPTRTVTTLPQGVRLTPTQVKNGSITIPASVVTSNAGGTTQLMYVVQPTSSLGQVVTSTAGGAQKAVLLNFQSANGVLTSALNGSAVSVIPTKTTNTVQLKTVAAPRKHPAPLPVPPPIAVNASLKPILPKPHLSIRKTDTGIILQWRMPYNLDVYEGIASYQLFAYQETNAAPSTDMWRKVGDVKALALPMACTLTQFADKNKYYFAVRSVDVHKRIGAFSDPEEISL